MKKTILFIALLVVYSMVGCGSNQGTQTTNSNNTTILGDWQFEKMLSMTRQNLKFEPESDIFKNYLSIISEIKIAFLQDNKVTMTGLENGVIVTQMGDFNWKSPKIINFKIKFGENEMFGEGYILDEDRIQLCMTNSLQTQNSKPQNITEFIIKKSSKPDNNTKLSPEDEMKSCKGTRRVLNGAIEMYNFDNSNAPIKEDVESHAEMIEIIRLLKSKKFSKQLLTPPAEDCQYTMKNFSIKCKKHGSLD